MDTLPDILVLGGGGRQADAWLTGLLAGLEDGSDLRLARCDYFVGTSAGALVAARLAGGVELRRPSSGVDGGAPAEQSPLPNGMASSATAIAAPFAHIGLRVGTLPGGLLRAGALRLLPAEPGDEPLDFRGEFRGRQNRFDGRLRVVAVERRSGRRVTFGAPGAPSATVAEAVAASCSVPVMFAPTVIGDVEYVDGAVWSPTNADVAPVDRDAQLLLASPMASLHGPFNAAVRALSRTAAHLEAAALTARGARVRIITPDRNSAVSIGRDLMRDAQLTQTLEAGYRQGLTL
jgi:NTE family protein